VHQADIEGGAEHAQIVVGEAGMVIEQQRTHDAAPGDGVVKDGEKALAGLTEAGFKVGDDAAVVVEQAENDDPLAAAGAGVVKHRAVQGITLPEFTAHGSLPAIASGAFEFHSGTGEALVLEEALDGGDFDLMTGEAS